MTLQEEWRDESECYWRAKKDAFLESAWVDEEHPLKSAAKQICLSCPVRLLCLQDALDDEEAQGIRGGYEFDGGTVPVAVAREIRDTLGLRIRAHQSTGRAKS